MKKFPKILITLLVLALFVGMLSTVSFASQLKEVNLTVSQLQVGYYNVDLSGDLTQHCANPDITKETKNLVDNKSQPFYWSKPYRFDELKEKNGEPNPNASKVPAILIDVAKGGDGVAICGYSMELREYLDCVPYSFEIQATFSAGSNDWTKIFADSDTSAKWAGDTYSCEFAEVTVYKVRILFYEIGEADPAKDTAYGTLDSYSTRFSLSEINLLANRNTTTPTEEPTVAPTEAASRPGVVLPSMPNLKPTQTATEEPTAAPTVKPTEVPTTESTAAPTTAPATEPTTVPATEPTTAPTTAPSVVPTEATTPVTEPVATAPATEPVEQPTEAPAETVAPTKAPTEPTGLITTVPATVPATEAATEPDSTDPENGEDVSNVGDADGPDSVDTNNSTVIIVIVAIVAFAALAGVLVFFIIKKKRAQS